MVLDGRQMGDMVDADACCHLRFAGTGNNTEAGDEPKIASIEPDVVGEPEVSAEEG